MADPGVTLRFFGDASSAKSTLDELDARAKQNADKATARNAKSKQEGADQIATVKRWQQANNEAMAASIEQIKKRQQAVLAAAEASKKAQVDEQKKAYQYDQERLAHRQSVIARMTAMENEHAAKSAASFKGAGFKAFNATQSVDQSVSDKTKAIIAQVRAQGAFGSQVKKSTEELTTMGSVVDQIGSRITSLLGPAALVSGAVKLISAEWQNVIDRQQKAGQTALTFEEALGEATLNVGGVMAPDKLKARALKMSAETGVSPATAVQALSLSIKSGGATNEAEAERLANAAEVAGKLSPRAGAAKLSDTSGSIASYMARTGATAEQAGGVLLSMQSKSNIADSNEAMAAAGPTLANMLAQGASEGMAQALMPALSQAIEDTKGDTSSLAATQFTQSLAEAGQSRFKGQANIPDKMLAAMRADPELGRQFFAGELTDLDTGKNLGKPELGKGKAETFFRAISGDSSLQGDQGIIASYRKQFDEFSAQAITPQEAGELFNERLGQVRGATPTLQRERQLKSAKETAQISSPDAIRGVTREGMDELLQSSGMSWLGRKSQMLQYDLGGDPEKMLRIRADEMKADARSPWGGSEEQREESRRVANTLLEAANAMKESAQRGKNRNGNVEPVGAN